jgi:AcrR family transcriptional regulator
MAKTKEKEVIDASTEEKIKNAARIVFQKKGFAAARTRDIAEEAGINLALLNYYYRSKEKLFEIILFETLSGFFQGIINVLNDETTTFEKKIEFLVENYINKFINEPDIPMFVLNEIRNRPEELFNKMPVNQLLVNSVFVRQFQEKVAQNAVENLNILHLLLNILGLVAFPFLAKPFISFIGGLNELQFNQLIQKRKELIPLWIKAMMMAVDN